MTSELVHSLRLRFPKWIISWALFFMDALAGGIAFYIVINPVLAELGYDRFAQFQTFFAFQLGWGILFFLTGLFNPSPSVSRFVEIQRIILISFAVIVLAVFVNAVGWWAWNIPPEVVLNYWFLLILCFSGSRLMARSIQKILLSRGVGRENTIIVGYNPRGRQLAEELKVHTGHGYELVGFVRTEEDQNDGEDGTAPVILGYENNLKQVIFDHHVSHVVLAPERSDHARLMALLSHANGAPTSVKIIPDLYEVISGLARTQQLYGIPLIQVNPELNTFYNRIFKRILDFGLAIPLLVICLPLWALSAILIKLDSPGPVFYRQDRAGKGQKKFRIIKFRSMVKDAENWTGPVWSSEEDERITKAGRWMRRFRLDETPQLINVIKGEMSLVGPRPERPSIIDKLIHEYPFYYRRHAVRPGITGWAQIKHPYDRRIEDVRQKLKYDFYYIESLSLNLDLKILLNTVWVMLSGKGR